MPMTITLGDIARTLRDTVFPPQITLELCAQCNLTCAMCPHPSMKREKGRMSDQLFRRCVDEIASECRNTEVWLADHGESLLIGEEIIDKVRYAKSRGLTRVCLNTNGMLLSPALSEGMITAGLDLLVIGIDAVKPNTYSSIRIQGDLEVVTRNVRRFVEINRALGSGTVEVWVQFIEMDDNRAEREAFAEFWGALGVGVKVRKKLSWGACIDSPEIRDLIEERIACPWLINLMHVLWDGRVCRCSGDHECNYPKGSVEESSIAEIWRGPLRTERQMQLESRFDLVNDQCKNCIDWKVGAAEKLKPKG